MIKKLPRPSFMERTSFYNFSAGFLTLLCVTLTSCNVSAPTKVEARNNWVGQKPINGSSPKALNLSSKAAANAFGYDFNRDGVADWVVSGNFSIYLSQPGGTFKQLPASSFDPSEKGEEPWRMSAKLTDSGDLRITNNKYTPLGGSDHQNSYRFRFINGEFVLQEYSFGFGSSTRGSTYIFDLANHVYREQQAGRCDYAPEQPCPGTNDAKLGNVPKVTLRDFGGFYALGNAQPRVSPDLEGINPDNLRFFQKYILK